MSYHAVLSLCPVFSLIFCFLVFYIARWFFSLNQDQEFSFLTIRSRYGKEWWGKLDDCDLWHLSLLPVFFVELFVYVEATLYSRLNETDSCGI